MKNNYQIKRLLEGLKKDLKRDKDLYDNSNSTDSIGVTPITIAKFKGNIEVLEWVLEEEKAMTLGNIIDSADPKVKDDLYNEMLEGMKEPLSNEERGLIEISKYIDKLESILSNKTASIKKEKLEGGKRNE